MRVEYILKRSSNRVSMVSDLDSISALALVFSLELAVLRSASDPTWTASNIWGERSRTLQKALSWEAVWLVSLQESRSSILRASAVEAS